jgi:hypothetical protein
MSTPTRGRRRIDRYGRRRRYDWVGDERADLLSGSIERVGGRLKRGQVKGRVRCGQRVDLGLESARG